MSETTTRKMVCNLTAEERSERAMRVTELLAAQDEEKSNFSAVSAAHKGEMARLAAEISDFARRAHAGVEEREVEVAERLDADAKRVYFVRLDTGEEFSSRAATPGELQTPLPFALRAVSLEG